MILKKNLSITISILISLLTLTTSTGIKAFALPKTDNNEQQEHSDIINQRELDKSVTTDAILDNELISSDKLETNSNVEKIQILDNNISLSIDKIKKIDNDIKENKKDIEVNEKEIAGTQVDYNETKTLINNKNLISTKTNKTGLSLVELVLKSDNFNDLFKSLELYKNIVKVQNKSLKVLNDKEKQLSVLKEDLNTKNNELEDNQKILKEENEKLEEMKKEVLDDIRTKFLNDNSKKNVIIPPNIDVKASKMANEVITESYKYLGVPYLWGGTTPSGFDCSGLTQYIYNKIGTNIPRVAEDQQRSGTPVSLNDLKPGDLIFWGNPAHHVGMYIGDGLYIQAPQTGDFVKISKLITATNAVRYITDYNKL